MILTLFLLIFKLLLRFLDFQSLSPLTLGNSFASLGCLCDISQRLFILFRRLLARLLTDRWHGRFVFCHSNFGVIISGIAQKVVNLHLLQTNVIALKTLLYTVIGRCAILAHDMNLLDWFSAFFYALKVIVFSCLRCESLITFSVPIFIIDPRLDYLVYIWTCLDLRWKLWIYLIWVGWDPVWAFSHLFTYILPRFCGCCYNCIFINIL